jgi:hypothetical protein
VREYTNAMSSLGELQMKRGFACRLTPDRTLRSIDEADEFLHDRGLLTRTADSALPSLYEACHERPYKARVPGFATWPATKWPWFGELGARHLVLKVHRGKNLLVTEATARLLDPICRAELARMTAADPAWAHLLAHLAEAGPSLLEDLQLELGLKPKELKSLRAPLERCGALVARYATLEHAEDTELARWDQVVPNAGGDNVRTALQDLLVAGVRAAVVAPERELKRWFSWQWYWDAALVDELMRDGRLRRVDDHVTAT